MLVYPYVCKYMYILMCVRMYVCMCVCMYVCMYVCMHMRINMCAVLLVVLWKAMICSHDSKVVWEGRGKVGHRLLI